MSDKVNYEIQSNAVVNTALIFHKFKKELEEVQLLITDVTKDFALKVNEVENEVKELEEPIDLKKIDEIIDRNLHKYLNNDSIYPKILMRSILLMIISLFEKEFCEFCDLLKIVFSSELSYKDLSGQGIEKNQSYLKKVLLIKEWDKSIEWDHIILYIKIRNIIAHNGSSLIDNKILEIPYIIELTKKDYFKVDKNTEILVTKDFLFVTINDILIFWNNMKNMYREMVKKAISEEKES